MFEQATPFSGFTVNDLAAARTFYGEILGITVVDEPGMGFRLSWPSGHSVFIYAKPDHQPASFTILNFPVKNIDEAVGELAAKGVPLERYENLPAPQDDTGVLRGLQTGYGPDIAWFKDPAGNILSVLQAA